MIERESDLRLLGVARHAEEGLDDVDSTMRFSQILIAEHQRSRQSNGFGIRL